MSRRTNCIEFDSLSGFRHYDPSAPSSLFRRVFNRSRTHQESSKVKRWKMLYPQSPQLSFTNLPLWLRPEVEYFGHLMQKVDPLKDVDVENPGRAAREKKRRQRMRILDGATNLAKNMDLEQNSSGWQHGQAFARRQSSGVKAGVDADWFVKICNNSTSLLFLCFSSSPYCFPDTAYLC